MEKISSDKRTGLTRDFEEGVPNIVRCDRISVMHVNGN